MRFSSKSTSGHSGIRKEVQIRLWVLVVTTILAFATGVCLAAVVSFLVSKCDVKDCPATSALQQNAAARTVPSAPKTTQGTFTTPNTGIELCPQQYFFLFSFFKYHVL